jgi:REP element-mobilizing transposase RayT
MARKPRVHYPGALYHVILRGNSGQTIFFDDNDRTRFYLLIQEGVERFGHRIHAFCLMTNHVHLAIQIADISLSRILQNLSFRYTRWVNWRQGKTGHLFQGRYKAVLIDADTYLQELTRYIHLNPVRAGMVRETEKYPWSSYRAYLGLETIPWLTTDWVLSQFSKRLSVARRAYMRFIQEGKGGGHQEEYHRGSDTDSRILGDDTFIGRVLDEKQMKQRQKVSLDKIMVEVCRYLSLKEKDLGGVGKDRRLSEVRGIAAWLVLELGVCTLGELGKRTGRDVSTLSSAARRLQIRSKTDLKLAERMKEGLEAGS